MTSLQFAPRRDIRPPVAFDPPCAPRRVPRIHSAFARDVLAGLRGREGDPRLVAAQVRTEQNEPRVIRARRRAPSQFDERKMNSRESAGRE